MLDKDANGEIDGDEFVQGLARFKGESRCYDTLQVCESLCNLHLQIIQFQLIVCSRRPLVSYDTTTGMHLSAPRLPTLSPGHQPKAIPVDDILTCVRSGVLPAQREVTVLFTAATGGAFVAGKVCNIHVCILDEFMRNS